MSRAKRASRAEGEQIMNDFRSSPRGNQVTPWQPQRYLAPFLAEGIADAKRRTGLSWRAVARLADRSHGYLILLSQGKRVPSQPTVEALAGVLLFDGEVLSGLRAVAVDREEQRSYWQR